MQVSSMYIKSFNLDPSDCLLYMHIEVVYFRHNIPQFLERVDGNHDCNSGLRSNGAFEYAFRYDSLYIYIYIY